LLSALEGNALSSSVFVESVEPVKSLDCNTQSDGTGIVIQTKPGIRQESIVSWFEKRDWRVFASNEEFVELRFLGDPTMQLTVRSDGSGAVASYQPFALDDLPKPK
jgi:hypothetical protein